MYVMGFAGAIALLFSSFAAPLGMPPGPEDPLMAAVAPDECLMYSSWVGTVAPDANGNVTERWMAQPELQEMWTRVRDFALSRGGDGAEATLARAASQLSLHLATHSTAFWFVDIPVSGPDEHELTGGVVVDFGDQVQELLSAIALVETSLGEESGTTIESLRIGDREFRSVHIEMLPNDQSFHVVWGMLDERHFALTVEQGEMAQLIERSQTPPPAWYARLREQIAVPRVSSVSWVDGNRLVEVLERLAAENPGTPVRETIEVLGLRGFSSLGLVAGLDETGFVCRARIDVQGEPAGVFDLFGDDPLTADRLGRLPDDQMFAAAGALSPTRVWKLFRELNDLNEYSREEMQQSVAWFNENTGMDLDADVIAQLDEYAFVYGTPVMTDPSAGWVYGTGASREMALSDPHQAIVQLVESSVVESGNYEFDRSETGGNVMNTLKSTDEWGFLPDYHWSLARGELVFSSDKSSLRRHLRREDGGSDALTGNEWFRQFLERDHAVNGELVLVASIDVAKIIEMGIPLLKQFGGMALPEPATELLDEIPDVDVLTRDMKPGLTAIYRTVSGYEIVQRQTYPGGSPVNMTALTLFGGLTWSMESQRLAEQAETANRLRMLVIAIHEYNETHGRFPARFSRADEETPLLSWRVHILPQLGYQDLYDQFHLDEPWDSEHNKALIIQMPWEFTHPHVELEEGYTLFLVPQGTDSLMVDPTNVAGESDFPLGSAVEEITDGLSSTALILEMSAEHAVPWTQPQDFTWEDVEGPESQLNAEAENGPYLAFADGHVEAITLAELSEIFELLVQKSDGEIPTWGDR